ncbi:MAG TPA: hypothetical protein VFO60_05490 [Candidatus Dormibacteraeota bacterium]|nr:hypothetical protein [Candidatus Dormibacteraeota bacterium]
MSSELRREARAAVMRTQPLARPRGATSPAPAAMLEEAHGRTAGTAPACPRYRFTRPTRRTDWIPPAPRG